MTERLPFSRPRSLILLVGPLGLVFVRPEAPGWPLLFVAGLAASSLLEPEIRALGTGSRTRRVQNGALLMVIVLLAILAPAPLLDWFLRFAVLLGLSLAFAPTEPQREWKLLVVNFLLLLIAAAQTEEAVYAVPFATFLALLPAALADLERARLSVPASETRAREAWRGVPLALLSLALFFAIPRTTKTLVGRGLLRTGDQGAMGETLTLSSITDIKQSARVAMRVQVDRPLPPDTKWRGSAFDRFDGVHWRHGKPLTGLLKRRTDVRGRLTIREAPRGAPTVRQHFQLEPGLASVLFAAPRAISIESTGFVQLLQREDDLVLGYLPPVTLRYTVTSVPPERAREGADAAPTDQHRYLELPDRFPSDLRDLAADVTRNASDDRARLEALEAFFHREFRYSLSVERDPRRSPLEDFLLQRREGHCEFFASGMVVLARSLAVPARLVDGFALGEYSELSSTYVVRRSDAHAWVEAYIKGEGWVPFDPTPSSSDPLPLLSRVRESLVKAWTRFVADYSLLEQRLVLTALRQGLHALARSRGVLIGLLGLGILLFVVRHLHRFPAPVRASRAPWTRCMRATLRCLARIGVVRKPDETMREVARRAAARGRLPSLEELVRLHEEACYGPPNAWNAARARELLRSLAAEVLALRASRLPREATAP